MSDGRDQDAGRAEQALIDARREKAERVRGYGNPFANDVDFARLTRMRDIRMRYAEALTGSTEERRYDPERVAGDSDVVFHVAGRVMARRGFGKASFLRVRDATDEIQLFAKKDVMGDAFARLEDIDLADHVEASGRPMVTRTGELSLQLSRIRLLTKAYRPLPDKWHGLTDVDLRYRRRYVDLVANPEVTAVLRARALIIHTLREFLDARGFLEVETPTLHSLVGGAAARPFNTHHNALDLELFLRIAPELYLKRLLVGGLERVYEIGRCYRNEGLSTRHNPEFTMLEFYQAYATYETLMDLAEGMLRFVDRRLEAGMANLGLDAVHQRWQEARPFTLDEPFARVPLAEAVAFSIRRAELPEDLLASLSAASLVAARDDDEGERARTRYFESVDRYRALSPRAGEIEWGNLLSGLGACESDGERLFVAYEYLAEPFLAADYRSRDGSRSLPVFIRDYPAEVSPLARRSDAHPELTDRFELFVDSRELCNAFSELNDPDDQEARFQDQVARKSRGQDEAMDYDADYIRALQHGMPPAAGFGLGVDRLTMMLTAQPSIRDVIAFPLLRPETGP